MAQFDDLRFLPVNMDTQTASYGYDFFQKFLEVFLALVDYDSVVHIRIVAVDAFHCFTPGVYGCRVVRSQDLRDWCPDTQRFSHVYLSRQLLFGDLLIVQRVKNLSSQRRVKGYIHLIAVYDHPEEIHDFPVSDVLF